MSTTATLDTVETRIADLVSTFVRLPQGVRLDESCEPILQATTHQAVTSSEGGKRLRALLALDAYRALGGDAGRERRDAMLDLSCAIEVFQTAALVHDDIIDDADLRRGKPAAHKALAGPDHDAALGVGLGIMLGDLLATASVDIATTPRTVCRAPTPSTARSSRCIARWRSGRCSIWPPCTARWPTRHGSRAPRWMCSAGRRPATPPSRRWNWRCSPPGIRRSRPGRARWPWANRWGWRSS